MLKVGFEDWKVGRVLTMDRVSFLNTRGNGLTKYRKEKKEYKQGKKERMSSG